MTRLICPHCRRPVYLDGQAAPTPGPATATDHPRELVKTILDYTPTIHRVGNVLTLSFDAPDQVAEVYDLIWHAINSVKP